MQQKQLYFDYISPRCDHDIESSEPIFPHDTLRGDNTPLYQVWLKTNSSAVQEILSGHDRTHGENIIRTNIYRHFEPSL